MNSQPDDFEPRSLPVDLENQKLLLAFADLDSSEGGKAIIANLRQVTLEAPTWDADHGNPIYNGFYREGQNCLMRYILSCIETGKIIKKQLQEG